MARKTRKQKQRAARRPTPAQAQPRSNQPWDIGGPRSAPDTAAEALQANGSEPVPAAVGAGIESTTADAPARRRIERLSQATPARAGRGRGPSNAAAMFQPLDTEEAAIPFDRVPYVPADLRRVAIMAALMIVLIIIAAVIVTHIVQ